MTNKPRLKTPSLRAWFLGAALVINPASASAIIVEPPSDSVIDRLKSDFNHERNKLIAGQLPDLITEWVALKNAKQDASNAVIFIQKLVNQYHCSTLETCPVRTLALEENGKMDSTTIGEVLKILINHNGIFQIKNSTLVLLEILAASHPQIDSITERLRHKYPIALENELTTYLQEIMPVFSRDEDGKIEIPFNLSRIRNIYNRLTEENKKADTPRNEQEIFVDLIQQVIDSDITEHLEYFSKLDDMNLNTIIASATEKLKKYIDFVNTAESFNESLPDVEEDKDCNPKTPFGYTTHRLCA